MIIETALSQPFRAESWSTLVQELFQNEHLNLFPSPQTTSVEEDYIISKTQLGNLELSDGSAALLVIETSEQIMLARNGVALRNYVARFIDEADTNAVIAVFHQEGNPDWRITYASKQTTINDESGEFIENETAPKRFTFLVGKNEPCRIAAERLKKLQLKGADLTLSDIEDGFSIERLSKIFFNKYLTHYEAFCTDLLSDERAADTRKLFGVTAETNVEAQDKAGKPVRDFVKKLLGRLVFLQFLQKKGWLNCPPNSSDWTDGENRFLLNFLDQATESDEAAQFHSRYLTKLFFEALNTERKGDIFPLRKKRIPYLNGGLFDADPAQLQRIDFPAELFENFLNFFGEYNFTIDENDPDDHEVGIDPEMLGHIFENLLEDNKDKGAYYTPKPIVAYMCQQSVLHYLETHLGKNEALTRLVEIHDPSALTEKDNWCAAQAKKIATLLEKVKICDPAIGSGACPIGMLNEIVHIRTLLNAEFHDPAERSKLKKSIIQKSIYGVDLDLGAVEIARLRFWLALVVDEIVPQPLPNLDYKIMQGNSLLESFEGVDLSRIHEADSSPTHKLTSLISDQGEFDLTDSDQLEFRAQASEKRNELLEARRAYFAARKLERKVELRKVIDQKVIEHLEYHVSYQLECEEIQLLRIATDWKEKREKTSRTHRCRSEIG